MSPIPDLADSLLLAMVAIITGAGADGVGAKPFALGRSTVAATT
jgi:hypothetical protein